jgi:hypothetical protein
MNQLEQNIINSFDRVRTDIDSLRSAIYELQRRNEELTARLDSKVPATVVVKECPPEAPKFFVASKQGKSAHEENCPFARNIKPDRKLVFDSKSAALEAGFKACECMRAY